MKDMFFIIETKKGKKITKFHSNLIRYLNLAIKKNTNSLIFDY
jgi:hypothetical protein